MNLFHAHTQWATRPEDERFTSIEDMAAVLFARRRASIDVPAIDLRQMKVRADEHGFGIAHEHAQSEIAHFTHWSLGQWCSRTGVPRDLLGRVDRDVALAVMDNRLARYTREVEDRETRPRALYGQNGLPILRSFHGSAYERLWDSEVCEALIQHLPDGWRNPVAYLTGKAGEALAPSGLYASDRDAWAFFVTGGDFTDGRDWNTVDVNGDVLQRGFFVWNSEVGKTSFGWASFWFRVVCGNHIVWGVEDYTETRAVHRASVRMTFERGFVRFLQGLGAADTRDAFARLVKAAQSEIAAEITRDASEDVPRATKALTAGRLRFTATEIAAAREAVLAEEKGVTGTRWDWLNGMTAHARAIANADDRVELERRAAAILLGAK